MLNIYRLLVLYVNIYTSSEAMISRDFRSAVSSAKERVNIFTYKVHLLPALSIVVVNVLFATALGHIGAKFYLVYVKLGRNVLSQ